MINELYHDVNVGFNAWFVVGPAMMIVMWFIGVTSNTIDVEDVDLEIYTKKNERSLKVMAGFLDVLFHALVVWESGRGIFQILVNHMDNPAYAFFVIPFLAIMSVTLCGYVLYVSARFGKWTSLGYLVSVRAQVLEEREERRKRRFTMITLEKDSNIVDFTDLAPEIDIIR